MAMLTLDYIAEDLVERYSGFISTFTWYRLCIVLKNGAKKAGLC